MNDIEIIAEIGVNHNGDFDTACTLINYAQMAGCNTAKFQLFDAARVYPRDRWEEMKKLEVSRAMLRHLHAECNLKGLRFLVTPDTFDDARYLAMCGVERIKIGSSNITNLKMLRGVADLGLPVILSTGACEWNEITAAVDVLKKVDLTLMHCVSAYPAPSNEMNLLVIRQLYKRFRRPIGLSDHTLANANAATVALGLGARIFEKHLTTDPDQPGPDHAMSLDLVQMSTYVRDLRDAALMLGTGVKQLMPSEVKNRVEYDRFVAQQMAGA